MNHGPGNPEGLAGQGLGPFQVVLAQSDQDPPHRLALDAVTSCDHVSTRDEDAATLALTNPDQGLPGEGPEPRRLTVQDPPGGHLVRGVLVVEVTSTMRIIDDGTKAGGA